MCTSGVYRPTLFYITLCATLQFAPLALVFGSDDLTCGTSSSDTGLISHEKQLIQCLFGENRYDKRVRPVLNHNDTVTVEVHLVMAKIIGLEEKSQTLITDGWLHMGWTDEQLIWDPDKYGGVEQLRIPVEEIWTPDIVLYNNARDSHAFMYDRLVELKHNGRINWVPHAHTHSFCALDMSRFPYDEQTCTLYFGSWTYDRRFINVITQQNIQLQFLYETDEFEILHFTRARKELKYQGTEVYPYIEYTLQLKRRSQFHQNMFVGPAVILAILNIFQFFIPVTSAQRITLSVGILLTNTLLFVMLEDYMPTGITNFPVIGVYYTFNMIMTVIAVIISSFVLRLYQPNPNRQPLPEWVRKIFLQTCAKFLCVKQGGYRAIPAGDLQSAGDMNADEFSPVFTDDNNANELTSDSFRRSPTLALEKTLEEIRKYLRQLAERERSPQQHTGVSHIQLIQSEWQRLGDVIDRLFFWSYALTTFLMTIVLIGYK